ncbi:MAG: hypothetical protein GY913_35595 [Proteobacteria bacterium]|nr:hypothetical protein [Pseudomonadota bacterium]MCP4922257.1 hypothetical protein [Pseudomonadota bacterium]
MDRTHLVETYLRAKDHQQPLLYTRVFHPTGVFSSTSPDERFGTGQDHVGLEAIVAAFAPLGQFCEDIVTVVPRSSVADAGPIQTSTWLVGMRQRHDGQVRLAAGTYRWVFRDGLAERLDVEMIWVQVVAPEAGLPMLDWLFDLAGPLVDTLARSPAERPELIAG